MTGGSYSIDADAKKRLKRSIIECAKLKSDKKKREELLENIEKTHHNTSEIKSLLKEVTQDDFELSVRFAEIMSECKLCIENTLESDLKPSTLLKQSLLFETDPKQFFEEQRVTDDKLPKSLRKIKEEVDKREYVRMIRNTLCAKNNDYQDSTAQFRHEIAREISSIGQQFWSFVGIMSTLVGTFVFGYYSSSIAFQSPSSRATFGLILMSLVLIAETYFIAKTQRF